MSIYVVAAKRTPFGSFGGSLKAMSATDLCVSSTKVNRSGQKHCELFCCRLSRPFAVDILI